MLRLLGVLTLLVLVFLGLGFVFGWYQVSAAETGTGFTVTFDKEKLKEDVDKAKQKVKDLTSSSAAAGAASAAGVAPAMGALGTIDARARTVVLKRDGLMDESFAVTVDAVISRDGSRCGLDALQAGDRATLTRNDAGEVTALEATSR